MTQFYKDIERFPVSVDCVIFGLNAGKLSLLLVKRRMEPEMGRWSLMGGFVKRDESVDEAAARVLYELAGLENVYMRQVGAFGSIGRDPGERVISIAYCALVNFNEHDCANMAERNARWIPLNEVPDLGFDHEAMIEAALNLIRNRLTSVAVVSNLLPKYFTLTALQKLHESVLQHTVDKRNFRKRMIENPSLVKTELIDKKSSRRGAALYTFKSQTKC